MQLTEMFNMSCEMSDLNGEDISHLAAKLARRCRVIGNTQDIVPLLFGFRKNIYYDHYCNENYPLLLLMGKSMLSSHGALIGRMNAWHIVLGK